MLHSIWNTNQVFQSVAIITATQILMQQYYQRCVCAISLPSAALSNVPPGKDPQRWWVNRDVSTPTDEDLTIAISPPSYPHHSNIQINIQNCNHQTIRLFKQEGQHPLTGQHTANFRWGWRRTLIDGYLESPFFDYMFAVIKMWYKNITGRGYLD